MTTENVVKRKCDRGGRTIGIGRVAHSPADGGTVSFGHLGTHVVNGAIYRLPFDLINDPEPIGLIGANPILIVNKNAVPAKSREELIAWIRSNQGKAVAGTAGIGSGALAQGSLRQEARTHENTREHTIAPTLRTRAWQHLYSPDNSRTGAHSNAARRLSSRRCRPQFEWCRRRARRASIA